MALNYLFLFEMQQYRRFCNAKCGGQSGLMFWGTGSRCQLVPAKLIKILTHNEHKSSALTSLTEGRGSKCFILLTKHRFWSPLIQQTL